MFRKLNRHCIVLIDSTDICALKPEEKLNSGLFSRVLYIHHTMRDTEICITGGYFGKTKNGTVKFPIRGHSEAVGRSLGSLGYVL